MTAARALALASTVIALGCDRTVDDGRWTFTWRLDGRELSSTSEIRYESCAAGSHGTALASHLRASKSAACRSACPALDGGDDAARACVLRCDANVAFVSARCEPTSHVDPSPIFAR